MNKGDKLWYVYVHPNLDILPQIEVGIVKDEYDDKFWVHLDDNPYGGWWEKKDRNLCRNPILAAQRLRIELRKRIRELQRVIRKAEMIIKVSQ